jgi:excisionase family DNA binding protein
VNDNLHPIPQLLKIHQVAEILQISRTSAYRLAARGELPSVRFSENTVRVRLEDLEAFISANVIGNGQDINHDQ